MEISTWILLLLLYIISFWLRKKRRAKFAQRGTQKPKVKERVTELSENEEFLPKWFKEIISPEEELIEPESEIKTVEKEMEVSEPKKVPKYEEIPPSEGPHEGVSISPIFSALDKEREEKILKFEKFQEEKRGTVPIEIDVQELRNRLTNVESIGEAILLKEILGPPRAIKRYNRREFV